MRIARTINAVPVVIAVAPRIGSTTVTKVEEFMLANAEDIGWGLLDFTGRVRLNLPSCGIDLDRKPMRTHQKRETASHRSVRLFSDLNRWLLKVLLMRDTPEGMWGGPRTLVDSPTRLGSIAEVSTAKAHRFCRAFEDRNFLRRSQDGLKIVRKRLLIDAWLSEEVLQYRPGLPVRCMYGKPKNILDVLESVNDLRFAISGFEACRQHGVLHTASPHLLVQVEGEFDKFLKSWELEECHIRDAHLVLRRTRYPESVFRGWVVQNDLPVVDVLQAALDVRPHVPRGSEQAEYIIEHVLDWGGNK